MTTTAEPQNARSRRTRTALLAAIHSIVEENGFDGLTMAEVAQRAGVSRRAVYLHFTSRSELIPALHDYVVEVLGLEDSLAKVWAASDSVAALDEWAAHLTRVHTRAMAVDRAVRYAQYSDPEVAKYRKDVSARQMVGCRRLIQNLDADGKLAPQWTVETGVDMLWALISTDVLESLLRDRGWSKTKLREHLAILFRQTFVAR